MSATTRSARALAGTRVLVTRARAQASELTNRLAQLGAEVVELPAIEITAAPPEQLDAAIRHLEDYDWLVFTSVNAVAVFLDRLDIAGAGERLQGVRVAAIGPATADRLRERGVAVDLLPERFVAESLVEALIETGIAGKRVLLPRADIARDTLPDGLRRAEARVDVVVVYHTRRPAGVDDAVLRRIRSGEIDVITFASPSTVRNLAELLGDERPNAKVVCIGPITAAAASERGFEVHAEAEEFSIPGLVEAVVRLVEEQGSKREASA